MSLARVKNFAKNKYYAMYKRFCPTKPYLDHIYYQKFGKHIDWKNPKTFNEKLQWLKVYDHNPLYTQLVDKYEVRKYVAEKIGEEYLIPCLGVWDTFEDIDFDTLPDRFVLKCTHDSGSIVVCRDKSNFDISKAREKLNSRLKENFYYKCREWPYKNVKPRIIAEQYMEDSSTKELRDYKFFTFDGVAKALFIASDRLNPDEPCKFDFFDTEFKHMDIRHGHPNSTTLPNKPENFDKMIELAEKISNGFPECRIDFYEVNGKAYFGEITLFNNGGFVPFEPEKWDDAFGSWIKLPEKMGGGIALISEGAVLWVHHEERSECLTDYKFFCFNGQARFMYISKDIGTNPTTDFFDMDFNHMEIRMKDPNSGVLPEKPECFDHMRKLAEKLSCGFPHVRADFYYINHRIYFGELTFYHCSGFAQIHPNGIDRKIGDFVCLDHI